MTLQVERAYTNLLNNLQRRSSGLPLQTIFSAVTHYLSTLLLPHPTQLTAFVISSSLWQPLSVETLWSLANVYRSAVHLKNRNIETQSTGWFSRSHEALLAEWIRGVMQGVDRGDPQLRIAILGGLLLGLEDLKPEGSRDGVRERVEDQVIIACAEALEILSSTKNGWKAEFTTSGNDENIFSYITCQILPLVASSRLRALDLAPLVQLLQKSLKNLFLDGAFLDHLILATTREPNGQVNISLEPTLLNSLRRVIDNPLYQTAGSLAKLLSRTLSQLTEISASDAWHAFNDTCQVLESMTHRVEMDWKASLLAAVSSEQDIGLESRESSTKIWSILKTLLFSVVLVSRSILSDISYMGQLQKTSSEFGPSSIARTVLRSLCHLSFTLPQFGGVTSSGEGFKELKVVFYTALDIVAADTNPGIIDSFVEELLSTLDRQVDLRHPFRQAKTVYILTIIEQLVPVLSNPILECQVIPFCYSHLNDPQNRETFEAAHSAVLSIFAGHAQRMSGKPTGQTPPLAVRLVPFYVDSLMENSSEGRLNRAQLTLAYSSLVRSAASGGDDALVWLCVEALLSRIKASAPRAGRSMDLYMTFISLVACVPLSLLSRVLQEVERILDDVSGEDRQLLADAIVEEVTNRVGDREREVALKWWCNVTSPRSSREQVIS